MLGQDPAHELMALFAQALRELGALPRRPRARSIVVDEAGGSAERLAAMPRRAA